MSKTNYNQARYSKHRYNLYDRLSIVVISIHARILSNVLCFHYISFVAITVSLTYGNHLVIMLQHSNVLHTQPPKWLMCQMGCFDNLSTQHPTQIYTHSDVKSVLWSWGIRLITTRQQCQSLNLWIAGINVISNDQSNHAIHLRYSKW